VSAPYAFVARIEAKPDKADEVDELLAGALPLAQAEPVTVDWYAARTSSTTFWFFDTFATEDARQAQHQRPDGGGIHGEGRRALSGRAGDPACRHRRS
jgi:quinol monooxygenase YgiN